MSDERPVESEPTDAELIADLEQRLSTPKMTLTVLSTVDTWFQDQFPGSIVARDTQVWNHVYSAKEDLKRRLESLGL